MGNVAFVRDRQPQLKVGELLVPRLVDIDSALKASLYQMLIRVLVNVFEVEHEVLLAKSAEIHVELSGYKHLCHEANDGRIHGNLDFEEAQNVVDCIEACHGRNAHEVGHVDQRLRLKQVESSVLREQLAVLEQICRQELILLDEVLEGPYMLLVLIGNRTVL